MGHVTERFFFLSRSKMYKSCRRKIRGGNKVIKTKLVLQASRSLKVVSENISM